MEPLEVRSGDGLRSRKTVRYSEQIMSADKYPSIFSRQMEAIAYIDNKPQVSMGYINNSLHLARKYARNLSANTICSS